MATKSQREKIYLVNKSRSEKEKFYKTYKVNERNPKKWTPQYTKELVDALGASRQREKQNRQYFRPDILQAMHTYPAEMVETFGKVYKQMHPRSKEYVMSIGQKILDNPSQYPGVYHAIFDTNYFTPGVKKNIEDQLVSKLGRGYTQALTPKERKEEYEKRRRNIPQPQKRSEINQLSTKPKVDKTIIDEPKKDEVKPTIKKPEKPKVEVKKPEVKKVEITKQPKKRGRPKKEDETPKPQEVKRPVGRPKKEEGKIPDKFNGIEIDNTPMVEPTFKPNDIAKLKKSTEKFVKQAKPEQLTDIDKKYQVLQIENTALSPIRPQQRGENWQESTIGLTSSQRKRGLKSKDLFYVNVRDEALQQKIKKSKNVKIANDWAYAETIQDIMDLNIPGTIIPGEKIAAGFTTFNPETKKQDAPWHIAHQKQVQYRIEMRNPDTLEPIKSVTKKTAKQNVLGLKSIESDDSMEAKKRIQLLWEQRKLTLDPFNKDIITDEGEWELYGKIKEYKLSKKEREDEFKKKLEELNNKVFNPQDLEPSLFETPPVEWLEEPEPLPDLEIETPPDFDEIFDTEPEIEVEIEDKDNPYFYDMPEQESQQPDMDALLAIKRHSKKYRVGTENWFRCARIEFSNNYGDYFVLVDLAKRVSKVKPEALWQPHTEISYWYHVYGPTRCSELIRDLENESGLSANWDLQRNYKNVSEEEKREMRIYGNQVRPMIRKVLAQKYSGQELNKKVRDEMRRMGYEY